MTIELIPVTFLRRFRMYNVGETAGFQKALADKLVSQGTAKYKKGGTKKN